MEFDAAPLIVVNKKQYIKFIYFYILMSYYVPEGNWTNNVINRFDSNEGGILNYVPNSSPGSTDPAPGCAKKFNATYKCGSNKTEKSINSGDGGVSVSFDCSAEYLKCNDLKLTLTDDGKLTLTNLAGTTKYWDSITQFGAAGSNPEKNSIAIPAYAGDGNILPTDVTTGGGPGRRYKDNYLLPGQFLEAGQWIGSPTGTHRLMMTGPADNPANTLQVVSNILGCDFLDMTSTANETDIDVNATRIYTIPGTHKSNIGKLGYVNNYGQLQLYPESMTVYGSNFDSIGEYTFDSSAFIGAELTDNNSNNADKCKSQCLTYKGNEICTGIIFDNKTTTCQLLNKSVYGKPRIIYSKKDYYIRQKDISGQDVSCPVDVTNETATFWNDTTKSATGMSSSVKCGLANYTATERTKVAADLSNNLYPKINPISTLVAELHEKYKYLTRSIVNTKADIKKKMNEFIESKQDLADWTGDQLQNLQAMNEDRDLNMTSQNYRHILWSILAIIIIIATMKMTKNQ